MRTYLAPLACLALNLRNVAARMNADANPEGYDAAPMDMTSIDAGQLIAAGIGFSMGNCDTPFDANGELVGHTVMGNRSNFDAEAELHAARLDLEATEDAIGDLGASTVGETIADLEDTIAALSYADGGHSGGLADTSELCDTYWDAIADAHVEEMRTMRSLAKVRKGDQDPLHGTMEFWAAQRAARFDRLRITAKRLRKAGNATKLAYLKDGVAKRYQDSATLIAKRNQAEWFLLYLTSAQVSYLKGV